MLVNNRLFKIVLPFILLVLLLLSGVNIATAEQWLYVNPVRPNETISIETSPNVFGINDVLHEAKYCAKSSGFFCITTKGFQFYVPINISENATEWKKDNVTYKSKKIVRYNILGFQEPIFHIQRPEGEGVAVFLFSKKRGLIGLGGFQSNSMGFYLLAKKGDGGIKI